MGNKAVEQLDGKQNRLKKRAGEILKGFQDARKKLRKTIKNSKENPGDKPESYGFSVEILKNNLDGILSIDLAGYKIRLSEIIDSDLPEKEKLKRMNEIEDELEGKVNQKYEAIEAFMEKSMKGEKDRITRPALAKMERDIPKLTELLVRGGEKSDPLIRIFPHFVELDKLAGYDKDSKKSYEEILLESLEDPELQKVAFFMLSMATENLRKEFTEKFIKKNKDNPDKIKWLIDTGNRYGCYSAPDIDRYYEDWQDDIDKSDTVTQQLAKKVVDNYQEYRDTYKHCYTSMSDVSGRVKGLYTRDAQNPALKMLTFGNMARWIGYMASTLTIAANTIANRNAIKEDWTQAFKNPYVIAGIGLLGYLIQTRKGDRLKDLFVSKKKIEEEQNLVKLSEYMKTNDHWSRFLNRENGPKLINKYRLHLEKNPTVTESMPTLDGFREFCKRETEDTRILGHLDEMTKTPESKKEAEGDLRVLTYILLRLGVDDDRSLKAVMKKAGKF